MCYINILKQRVHVIYYEQTEIRHVLAQAMLSTLPMRVVIGTEYSLAVLNTGTPFCCTAW